MPNSKPSAATVTKGSVIRAWSAILVASLSACATLKDSPKYQLGDSNYHFRQKGNRYQKAWVYVSDDSIQVLSDKPPHIPIPQIPHQDKLFLKKSFDIDVITVGFKYRPATSVLPRQLTTDFNGNIYIGYRLDRFRVRYQDTPFGRKSTLGHRAITAGFFGGIGSTSITPWTTNNQQGDEYNAAILSRGVALMFGVKDLTVGLGIGWDYLTDRDKNIWIYQNKSWYGLTVGLNLN